MNRSSEGGQSEDGVAANSGWLFLTFVPQKLL